MHFKILFHFQLLPPLRVLIYIQKGKSVNFYCSYKYREPLATSRVTVWHPTFSFFVFVEQKLVYAPFPVLFCLFPTFSIFEKFFPLFQYLKF